MTFGAGCVTVEGGTAKPVLMTVVQGSKSQYIYELQNNHQLLVGWKDQVMMQHQVRLRLGVAIMCGESCLTWW